MTPSQHRPSYTRVGGFLMASVCVLLGPSCGHLKNMRDDFLDIGTLAVGVVPPVLPWEEERAGVGVLPPAFGSYLQVTDFLHFGALYKSTSDLEWDRRSLGPVIDERSKLGGIFKHRVAISEPWAWNDYKSHGSRFAGWRNKMNSTVDPVTGNSAKSMLYLPVQGGPAVQDYFAKGWQHWEFIQWEFAFPEPFFLHSGFYFRIGVDPSQILDFALTSIGWDLYRDSAFDASGDLLYDAPMGGADDA